MKKITRFVTGVSERVISKISDLIPPMDSVTARQERIYAERESAAMLELYRGVRSADTQLAGRKLYEKVVTSRLGCTEAEAAEIVRHADESYAQWPDDRAVTFRDVVHYVIVHHLLAQQRSGVGTVANTEEIVIAAIPGEL